MTDSNTHLVRKIIGFWFLSLGWFLSHSRLNSKGQQEHKKAPQNRCCAHFKLISHLKKFARETAQQNLTFNLTQKPETSPLETQCTATLWPSCDSAATSTVWNRRTKWYMAFCHCVMVPNSGKAHMTQHQQHLIEPGNLEISDLSMVQASAEGCYTSCPSWIFDPNISLVMFLGPSLKMVNTCSFALCPMDLSQWLDRTQFDELPVKKERVLGTRFMILGKRRRKKIRVCMTSCLRKKLEAVLNKPTFREIGRWQRAIDRQQKYFTPLYQWLTYPSPDSTQQRMLVSRSHVGNMADEVRL